MKKIDDLFPFLVAFRRDLHQHPELSNEEFRTQEKIIEQLKIYDIEHYKIAGTGVVGLIGNRGPVIGLRADIDALPIQEKNDVPYKSLTPGVMHACGHDVHTTILLGTGILLKAMEDELDCRIKLLFQPAEETTGGALPMIENGVLKNPTVDYVFGLHVMPYLDVGHIEMRHGQLNAASNALTIKIKGKKSHGAYPEKGTDAILIASHIITALQSLVSRNTSPLESKVLSIGSIHGGDKANIICDEVVLKGTLRTLTPKARQYSLERIEEIVKHQCLSFDADYELSIEDGYEALINDNQLVDDLIDIFTPLLGKEKIHMKKHPSLGVEDFSYFSNRVPGVFYHLGCKKYENQALHQDDFDVDESCIKTGILTQLEIVKKIIKG